MALARTCRFYVHLAVLHSALDAKRCIAERMPRRAEASVKICTLETNHHSWQADPVVHLLGGTNPQCAARRSLLPCSLSGPLGDGDGTV